MRPDHVVTMNWERGCKKIVVTRSLSYHTLGTEELKHPSEVSGFIGLRDLFQRRASFSDLPRNTIVYLAIHLLLEGLGSKTLRIYLKSDKYV